MINQLIFNWFKKIMPSISETEAAALKAGDLWFEAELFQGRPNWDELLATKVPTLSDAEQSFLNIEVEQLIALLDDWKITHVDLDLSKEAWDFIKQNRFFGLHIPKEYGGLGFSALANSTIVQKISTHSLSAAVAVMVPNSLGPAELLMRYGTDAQKQEYLPRLADGRDIPCFALTGPMSGSDAAAMPDRAVICKGDYQGQKDILGFKLTCDKHYITLAPIASLIGIAVKFQDPEHLLSDKEELGISLILIKRDTPGLEIGNRHYPLNQAFLNGPIKAREIFIPLDESLIGGREMIGRGWEMLMECLAAGRGISLPALASAVAKHGYCTTGAHALIRRQFGLPLVKFEGVAERMAEIAGYSYIIEATRVLALTPIAAGKKPSIIAAICKYHMTEYGRMIINAAMDIHGGRGIMLGPRNYLARAYQGIPISITVEGANILTRSLMIFGQGATRAHPYVQQEMQATNKSEFARAFWPHVLYIIKCWVKVIWNFLSFGFFTRSPKVKEHRRYYKQLAYYATALALCSEMAMLVLGAELKRRESLSARLGDVLSYLFMGTAVLKYSHDHGNTAEDRNSVAWCMQYLLTKIEQAITEFLANFPNFIIAKLLGLLILPVWRKAKAPKDKLSIQLAKQMCEDSKFRERMGENCVKINSMEQAFSQLAALKKGDTMPESLQQLVASLARVDEFKPGEL